MAGPLHLADWPWVVVEVECALCRRHGRYRQARLAERFGSGIQLWALLTAIVGRCGLDKPGVKPRQYEARCGVRFRVPAGVPLPEGVPAREARPGEPWPPRLRRSEPAGPLPTVGGFRRDGITHIDVRCCAVDRQGTCCHHTATLALAALGLPDDLPFVHVSSVARLLCRRCGSREARVMLCWPDRRGPPQLVIPGVTPVGRLPGTGPLPRPPG